LIRRYQTKEVYFTLYKPFLLNLSMPIDAGLGLIDVKNLALLIVDPDGKGLGANDHSQKTAYLLLVGCILHLCYKGQLEGSPATFGAFDQILADSSRPAKTFGLRCSPMVTATAEIIPLFLRPRAT
jgi:hypothetical protein